MIVWCFYKYEKDKQIFENIYSGVKFNDEKGD